MTVDELETGKSALLKVNRLLDTSHLGRLRLSQTLSRGHQRFLAVKLNVSPQP